MKQYTAYDLYNIIKQLMNDTRCDGVTPEGIGVCVANDEEHGEILALKLYTNNIDVDIISGVDLDYFKEVPLATLGEALSEEVLHQGDTIDDENVVDEYDVDVYNYPYSKTLH